MDVLNIIAIIACSVCFILNVFSIGVLVTTKKLKQSRFKTLVLLLSLSNAATGIEALTHSVMDLIKKSEDSFLYACLVLKHLIAGTITTSLYQTLLICLDRLNATFTNKRWILRKISETKMVAITFVIIHVYTLLHLAFDLTQGPRPCTVASTATYSFVLMIDIPVAVLIILVILLYSIIISRLIMHNKKIFQQGYLANDINIINRQASARSVRRNVLTLGVIIFVTFAANVLRCGTAFYSLYSGPTVQTMTLLKISNHFLLINPVFDPVIHALRIQEYRGRLRSALCCCIKSKPTLVIELTQVSHM